MIGRVVATKAAQTMGGQVARVGQTQQRRHFLDYITKYPDRVLETRKIQNKGGTLQGGMNPTWLKQPNDKFVSLFGLGLCTYGVVNLIIGHYRLATGKGKLD
eukprot:CAMPEP_0198289174 /NCGR_PEP_ID=MMETSP1449-20131203/7467_1 /TAXON_ID=420275 /ORGANISM="Attheya septentrionalis, Strain CCMP2084" /LENGTH=101 /DNA_ID=CAMNT_0043987471 /DNA_START=62 /DNA_END=367 /DNA_ORIENTATION=-